MGMFNVQWMSGLSGPRVLGLSILSGVISTCVSYYLLNAPSKRRVETSDDDHQLSHRDITSYGFDSVGAMDDSLNDFPPDFRVIIHGGAGVVSKGIDSKPFFDALTRIMGEAYKFAKDGDKTVTALDLAEYCVKLLEDDILFNAGRGAVFTAYETIEMEASIMDGRTLECGAVSLIKTVKHPISLARAVMELTKHNHLIGKAAEKLAPKANLEVVDPSYFSTPKRREQLKRAKEMGDSVVNDHDYEEDGDDTDENVPLAEPEPEIPNKITTTVTKNENSSSNLSTGNFTEEPDKITLVERIFIDDISTPDSGNSVTDSTEHEALDYDSSEYDSRMSKKYYDPPQTYNDNHDKNHASKSPNALEREREREKEKLLEAFYPGSTGTVGCVCMFHGHVAAATSTGGLTNKMAGRVGDTSIIGAGTYANDQTCAVSATGKGEEFMRAVAAYDCAARMEIGNMRLRDAAKDTVFKKLPAESGGIIAITTNGEYAMEFNSKGMFRAVCDSTGNCSVGIWQDMIPFHVNAQGRPSVIVTGYSEKMEMTEAISNKEFGLQWSNRQ